MALKVIFVRAHPRRRPTAHPSPRHRHKEPAYSGPSLDQVIDDVVSGRRSGFTWTGGYKFDIDDPVLMEALYDRLGDRTIYAIARTNRTLGEWESKGSPKDIGHNFGIGIWRATDGTVYADDVYVENAAGSAEDDQHALEIARKYNQFNFLKVDGRTRTWRFVEGPNYDVIIRGEGADRTFEPVVE